MKLVVLVLLLLYDTLVYSQYHFTYQNNIGVDPSALNYALNVASEELINSLPQTQHDSFLVFSFNFYLHTDVFYQGFPSALESAIEYLENNYHYFVLIGRESDELGVNTKYWIELKLPETDKFSCITSISPGYIDEIEEDLERQLNRSNSWSIEKEITAINRLRDIIPSLTNCCVNPLLDPDECNSCLISTSAEGNIPYETIFETLEDLGFSMELVRIVEDEEFSLPSVTQNSLANRSSSNGSLNATVDFYDNENQNLDELIDDFRSRFIDSLSSDFSVTASFSSHVFKYPRDCGQFIEKWNSYVNDDSDFSIFLALININNQAGYVAVHLQSNIVNQNLNRSNQANLNEALEGLREVYSEENVCSNLLLSHGNRFVYHVDNLFADLILTDQQKIYNDSYYERVDAQTQKAMSQAVETWCYYLQLEYNYLIESGSWRWSAGGMARLHLCGEFIHGAFDICGLTEPFGFVCDGINSFLYFVQGDVKNGIFSAASIIPVLGSGFNFSKLGGKVIKYASIDIPIGFSYEKISDAVHFIGGHAKLKWCMQKWNYSNTFAGVSRSVTSNLNEAHHLIPYQLFKSGRLQLPIFKRLTALGWHASDPLLNGLVIPKKLPFNSTFYEEIYDSTEKIFHSNHPAYNEWVRKALIVIDNNSTNIELSENVYTFTRLLVLKLENAYLNGKSINNSFKGIEDFKMSMLN